MAFAVVQVKGNASTKDAVLALRFRRLPGGREDGIAQGVKPVGTGDFALTVTRQAVGDADVTGYGEAIVLCLQMCAPLRHERFASLFAPGGDAVFVQRQPGAELTVVRVDSAVAVRDVRMPVQGLFEGVERDTLVTALDDAVGAAEQLQVFIDKVAGFQPAVRP